MMLIMKLLRFEALQELLHSSMVCKNHGVELRSHTETIRSSNLPHQWDVLSFFSVWDVLGWAGGWFSQDQAKKLIHCYCSPSSDGRVQPKRGFLPKAQVKKVYKNSNSIKAIPL